MKNSFEKLLNNPETLTFLKFITVGTLNTAVDYGVFFVLTGFGVWDYIAQTVSYAAGMLVSYTINSRWTFKPDDTEPCGDEIAASPECGMTEAEPVHEAQAENGLFSEKNSPRKLGTFAKFAGASVFIWGLSIALLFLFADVLGFSYFAAKTGILVITTFVSFFLNKLFVFK